MEDASLEGLFTNEEYDVKSFTFGRQTLHLRCLSSASTDYDLTGQILWPAATLLAQHLATRSNLMTNRQTACELGSGVGLTGLLCAQHCKTVLTDHNELVLKVLQENAAANQGGYCITCHHMDWESEADVAAVKSLSPNGQGYDLVLGADICYSLRALPHIFRAFAALLCCNQTGLGLLGYVSRTAAIDRGIHAEAQKAGLRLEEVCGSRCNVGGGLEGAVYAVNWPSAAVSKRELLAGTRIAIVGALLYTFAYFQFKRRPCSRIQVCET